MGIGQIIRKRREQLRFTQDQVAEQVGISKPYLSNIETGKAKNPPTDGVLKAIEKALRFEPGELLTMAHLFRTPPDIREAHEDLQAEVLRLRSALKNMADARAATPEGQPAALPGADAIDALVRGGPEQNIHTLSGGVVVPIINKVAAGYPQQFTDLDYPRGVADEYIRCPDIHDTQAFASRVVGDSMEPTYHEGDIVIFSPNTQPRAGDDCFIRFQADEGTTFKRMYQDNDTTIRLQPLNNNYPAKIYPLEQITGVWPALYRIEKLR